MAFRDFIMWFMGPETRKKAEAESRRWIATCPNCGAKTSIWDLGGIRYKASGNPSQGCRCKSCGKFGMHKVVWELDAPAAGIG